MPTSLSDAQLDAAAQVFDLPGSSEAGRETVREVEQDTQRLIACEVSARRPLAL